MPRRGKTFFVRLVLLYAALDPWVKILGADGKKSSDYDKVRLVAHRWVIGDAPNPRDNDPLEHLEEMLDEVLEHIAEVNDVLSSLPVEMCPEGKLTEELARDPRYPALRVWVLAARSSRSTSRPRTRSSTSGSRTSGAASWPRARRLG
jgi:S-DNA-T family DNA segregation ATPase FtsK/SpoIIIE